MEFFGNGGKNLIQIGSLSITMYAFLIMLGATIGAFIAIKEGEKLGLSKNKIIDGILYGVPLGIVGARLYYVIFEWERYYIRGELFETIKNIFSLSEGGLAITGGIIITVIFVYLYCKKQELNLLKIFDIIAPAFLIGQAFGRWGNFFNKEAYGGVIKNVDLMYKILPDFIMDGMYIAYQYRHPTFLYECLWNIVGLVIILVIRNKLKKIQIGDIGAFYLIWYGFGRAVLIEPYRTDALMLGDIRINVLIPALMVVAGISLLIVKHLKFPQALYIEEKNNVLKEQQDNENKQKIDDEKLNDNE